MKNNEPFTLTHMKLLLLNPKLAYKVIFSFIVCFVFFAGSLLKTHNYGTADAMESPFHYESTWAKYNDYIILNLTLHATEGNYTYAPNQEDVYPTRFTLYVKSLQENAIKDVPILFPIGIKKADPLNKSVQIYVYEKSENIFMLFPSTFAPLDADLDISFLACSAVRCQPLKAIFPIFNTKNVQEANTFPWFGEFEKRFIAMQNNDKTQVNLGNLPIKIQQKIHSVSIATTANPSLKNTDTDSNLQNTTNTDFDIDALRASISQNTSPKPRDSETQKIQNDDTQKSQAYAFSPRPLNSSLEVSSLYKALLFGLIAGFILNFMPCVLPVIALKVSAFLGSNQDEKTRRKSFREHNTFFALGIITWFMALGLLLGFAGLSWGQLFQSPLIVLCLLIFIFAMGLSLFGLFHLPILDIRTTHSNVNNVKVEQNGKLQAFISGLLATLLATPCSGPLLGAVLGYSLTQSMPVLLTIFLFMGLGMALPYIFFAINPSLIRFMPKAGNWMNAMEQILGFFLMATSVYLLSILPSDWYIKSLIILLLVAFSAYIWGKWGSFHSAGLKKLFIALTCLTLIVVPSSYLLKEKEQNILWENFNGESFNEFLGKEMLLLKFTADWCPTCKILEKTVFTKKNMQNIGDDYTLRFISVDITQFNEEKQNLLKSLDSVSIPLLAVFPKGELAKKPIIIRDLYTLKQLQEAIDLANK